MYVSRGGHGIHDVPSSSVSFFGGGDFKTREKREKKKEKKELPLESSPHPCDSSLSERERERERERKRKRKSVRHALITAPRSERAERGVDIQRKRERERA